jgi:hypothetical protein
VNFPGVPLTIDLFDSKLGHTVDYPVDLSARMVGSSRAHLKRNRVVWTLKERSQDGVPHQVPPVVIMVRYQSGKQFKAKFSLAAEVGFSLNPLRRSIAARKDDPVVFDEHETLSETIDSKFDNLDLMSLTRMDFSRK